MKKIKTKTFNILEISDMDSGELFETLAPYGLQDSEDIIDIEYLNDGERIRFKFYIDNEEE